MKVLLDRTSVPSFITGALSGVGIPFEEAYTKIGYVKTSGGATIFGDAGIVKRRERGGELWYVAVGLRAKEPVTLQRFFVELDKCMMSAHSSSS